MPMNEVVGAYYLAEKPGDYEVQRSNAFRFIVAGPSYADDIEDEVLGRAGTPGDSDADKISGWKTILEYSVDNAKVPTFTQEVITVQRGNSVVKFAGTPTFTEGSFGVNDYMGSDSCSALMAWQNLSYDVRTQAVGRAAKYKKTCYLQEYTPDFTKVVRTWTLYGCWVSGIEQNDFSMQNGNEVRTITATIQYDYAVMDTKSAVV